jgi:hypothetical protein
MEHGWYLLFAVHFGRKLVFPARFRYNEKGIAGMGAAR